MAISMFMPRFRTIAIGHHGDVVRSFIYQQLPEYPVVMYRV